jgi:hypothetical protein
LISIGLRGTFIFRHPSNRPRIAVFKVELWADANTIRLDSGLNDTQPSMKMNSLSVNTGMGWGDRGGRRANRGRKMMDEKPATV